MSARVYIDLTVNRDRTEDATVGYTYGKSSNAAERRLAYEMCKAITANLRAEKKRRERQPPSVE